MRLFSILLLASIIAACTQFHEVRPATRDIGGYYSVDPQISWSAYTNGKNELWTVDGPALQAIRFAKGLRHGEKLVDWNLKWDQETKLPVFKEGMTPNEIMEMVVDTLAALELADIRTRNLRPIQFGAADGFRFDLEFQTKEGLDMQGTVAGAVFKERLHLIVYYGTQEHYYAKHEEHVNKIIDSVRLL